MLGISPTMAEECSASGASVPSVEKVDLGGSDPMVRGQGGPWMQMDEPQLHMVSVPNIYV